MKTFKILGLAFLLVTFFACNEPSNSGENTDNSSKYEYETVENDPLNAKMYTLENGLKVYLSVNKKEPRIQTLIACKTGSKNDPQDNTGLAHYLEHMLFKGTSKFGSGDWAKESVLLKQISDLYEMHKAEQDPAIKQALYKKIDSLSHEASGVAIPNEYDKMITALGASGTNAYTSLEETVYTNDIPTNELERWMKIESERFDELVLRLFHTELEAVYEEFNIGQDSDSRKVFKAFLGSLFPTHTYGTQTTIGVGEHLKNPSMEAIHAYFDKYYVPNNMAICLSGDLDPDATIDLIEKYFGHYERKEVEEKTFPAQPEITEPIVSTVVGKEKASVDLGWRFEGAGTRESKVIRLIATMLQNGQAGLIDLNLLQQQKVLEASAWNWALDDYTIFNISAVPRSGQSLEEAKDLLLAQLELIKKGNFPDWLISASVKNEKLSELKNFESNRARSGAFVEAFILGRDWEEYINELNEISTITKEEVVAFANQNFKENYVVVYKKEGKDTDAYKVPKPSITPNKMIRDVASPFFEEFTAMPVDEIAPVFVDYDKTIKSTNLSNGVKFDYIQNSTNELFELNYVLDMGTLHNKQLGVAIKYLPYLGTDKYSAEELKQEFFKLGLSFDVYSDKDRSYITLAGLNESLNEGIELFEHILNNLQPNQTALDNVVTDILKQRADARKNKGTILRTAMYQYSKHGEKNSFTDRINETELKALTAEEMVSLLKSLTDYEHKVFYYGPSEMNAIESTVNEHHKVADALMELPTKRNYPELDINTNTVVFVDFDMVQAEIMMVSKGDLYNKNQEIESTLYNPYFGYGLSSIVFQEIRESKALAYSSWSFFSSPDNPTESHYLRAYVGTQVDKLKEAVPAMQAILEEMPVSEQQLNGSIDASKKKIESERTTGANIYWEYNRSIKKGLDYDINQDIYEALQTNGADKIVAFQKENIVGRSYTFLVLADKDKVDMNYLKSIGEVTELSLDDIF